jgi:hypothetical protein
LRQEQQKIVVRKWIPAFAGMTKPAFVENLAKRFAKKTEGG